MVPAADKELTFWGNFFSPKRRRSRKEVTSRYLPLFPRIAPTDFKVTGEAPNPTPEPEPGPGPGPEPGP